MLSLFCPTPSKMKSRIKQWLSIAITLLATAPALAEPVRLMTHDLPPYSYLDEEQRPAGRAIQPVTCALNAMQQPYEISFVPWARAQHLVKQGKADAFFAASYSAEREQYAKLSAQIAPQQWHWYLLKDNPKNPKSPQFKRTATVGGFSGGNMTDWLRSNNFRVMASPANNSQLLKMLLAERIDAILANQLVMNALLKETASESKVRSVLEQDKPLGVYFSDQFLSQQASDFMPRFNQALGRCRN